MDGGQYSQKQCNRQFYNKYSKLKYMQALELDPTNAKAWNSLGYTGGKVGGIQYSEKQCYEWALKLDPKLAIAWFKLGNTGGGEVGGVRLSQKRCYEQALKLDPTKQAQKE